MKEFANTYVTAPCSVADVGSFDVNGTFRPFFRHCQYEGLDVKKGPNVDRVVKPYDYGDKQYDVVVSGNTMEHVQDLHTWAREVTRICKPGGLICITAPHTWAEHRYPVDCWRILPDGMKWLFRELDILECKMTKKDTYLVARKNIL